MDAILYELREGARSRLQDRKVIQMKIRHRDLPSGSQAVRDGIRSTTITFNKFGIVDVTSNPLISEPSLEGRSPRCYDDVDAIAPCQTASPWEGPPIGLSADLELDLLDTVWPPIPERLGTTNTLETGGALLHSDADAGCPAPHPTMWDRKTPRVAIHFHLELGDVDLIANHVHQDDARHGVNLVGPMECRY